MATANFAAINEDFCDRGVLRWLTFNDGPHGYALGLWGTTDEVAAFIAGSATPDGVLPTVQHRHGGPRPCV
ncbi:MAG: hypothetical protein ACRDQI_13565 [Pseudonocardiaceae bacterium]